MSTAGEIIDFWFDPGRSQRERVRLWMGDLVEVDASVRERFGPDVMAASAGELEDWENDPQSCLSLILLLERLSISLFRGEARYFEVSGQALPIAMKAIRQGFDRRVRAIERLFYYFPLVRSEKPDMQERAAAYISALTELAGPDEEPFIRAAARCSDWHRKTLARFGRFPERNAVLGRNSSPAERAFLKKGLPTFAAALIQDRTDWRKS